MACVTSQYMPSLILSYGLLYMFNESMLNKHCVSLSFSRVKHQLVVFQWINPAFVKWWNDGKILNITYLEMFKIYRMSHHIWMYVFQKCIDRIHSRTNVHLYHKCNDYKIKLLSYFSAIATDDLLRCVYIPSAAMVFEPCPMNRSLYPISMWENDIKYEYMHIFAKLILVNERAC